MLLIKAGFDFAYIDPGSGSFLIQLLVGGLLAISFTLKTWRIKLMNFLRNLFKSSSSKDHESGPESKN